jgi:formate dehydrogenase
VPPYKQKRDADGTKDSLIRFVDRRPIERDYLIVDNGAVVSPSYSFTFKTKLEYVIVA